MDSIMCGIDRWNTGEHDSRSAPFEAKTYAPIHAESLGFLEAWMEEYDMLTGIAQQSTGGSWYTGGAGTDEDI
ncbi:hypothetical protein DFH09DRAFT_1335443 [Mycena vulgaris]|nr:hypothetical protein DFH09DRAFT_1335443 [Mycena vulgaris]